MCSRLAELGHAAAEGERKTALQATNADEHTGYYNFCFFNSQGQLIKDAERGAVINAHLQHKYIIRA